VRSRLAAAALVACVACGVASAPAEAASINWTPEVLTYSAGPGEVNNLAVSTSGGEIRLQDVVDISIPAECRRLADVVVCASATTVHVALEDGNDRIVIVGQTPPVSAHGDAGNDTLEAGTTPAELFGDQGDDVLDGGPASDALYGDPGNDRILGRSGNDKLVGDDGKDTLEGGTGRDSIEAQDFDLVEEGTDDRDRVRCGPGTDSARLANGDTGVIPASRGRDIVTDDCERVDLGLGGGAVRLPDPLIAGGRLRIAVPCFADGGRAPCRARVAARTAGGQPFGSGRAAIPSRRRMLVALTPTPVGGRLAAGSAPFTVRIAVSVTGERTTAFALRVHP
jgi:hypothetical protein